MSAKSYMISKKLVLHILQWYKLSYYALDKVESYVEHLYPNNQTTNFYYKYKEDIELLKDIGVSNILSSFKISPRAKFTNTL